MSSFEFGILFPVLVVLAIIATISLFVSANWRLYYLSSKIKGPQCIPFLASFKVLNVYEDMFTKLLETHNNYGPVTKTWIGPTLLLSVSDPKLAEFVCKNCLERAPEYEKFIPDFMRSSLITAKVDTWKKHRKIISSSFKTDVVNSFMENFAMQARNLVDDLGHWENQEIDLLKKVWKGTLYSAFEVLLDINPKLIGKADQLVCDVLRLEELWGMRFKNLLYFFDFFWNLSPPGKEDRFLQERYFKFLNDVLETKTQLNRTSTSDTDGREHKHSLFLNHLMGLKEKLSVNELLGEVGMMLIAGSETCATLISSALLLLGIYPDVQEKLFAEIQSVAADLDSLANLKQLKERKYLDCVIKETLRLLPPGPLIARFLDKEFKTDSYVFPAGSRVVIPIIAIHTNPDRWSDPWKFDPERFSDRQNEKLERNSFMPFSSGPRDCIGRAYAMMMAKIFVATVLYNYKVKCDRYKDIRDIKIEFSAVMKLNGGFPVTLERRM